MQKEVKKVLTGADCYETCVQIDLLEENTKQNTQYFLIVSCKDVNCTVAVFQR